MTGLERLRAKLTEMGITPSDNDDANVNALCDIYNLHTKGHPRNDISSLHIAEAIRHITEGWSLTITSRIHEEQGLIYEVKAQETMPKEFVGKFTEDPVTKDRTPVYVPRVVGLAVKGAEPQTPIDLANALLNVSFCTAMNAVLAAVFGSDECGTDVSLPQPEEGTDPVMGLDG